MRFDFLRRFVSCTMVSSQEAFMFCAEVHGSHGGENQSHLGFLILSAVISRFVPLVVDKS